MSAPAPPTDPRGSWDLPEPGSLPRTERLDEVVTRVLAPNPSPMTLDGTNTYVLGLPGSGEVLVVDPGPDDPGHLARVESVVRERDAQVRSVVVTHHHLDHSEAAATWARRFGTDVAAARVASSPASTLGEGDRVGLAGLDVEVVATPGHTLDHLSLRLGTGALLTGDHVLGRGTSVVAHPDGDLAAYLTSLRRVLELGPNALYPGHGPALTEDPSAVLRFYAEHREYRQQQLLASLRDGPATPGQLVARMYADVPEHLWSAAEASTRAAVDLLVARDRVRIVGDTVHLITG
jgi:glyoxylase-like metal-dependent hydrolase (beta-lactamase superfamily II)